MKRVRNWKQYVFLPFAPIWWGYQAAIKAVTAAVGLVAVPLTYRYRFTDIDMVPIWSIPWVNPEDWHGGRQGYDGSLPTWWIKREGDSFWSFYKYHAIRNPADGLRNFEWLNLKINPDKINYWTPKYYKAYEPWWDRTPGWRGYICWQNVWCGIKVQWIREKSYTEFKFGTRIEPSDAHGHLDPNGSRALDGASFASKFIPNRKI